MKKWYFLFSIIVFVCMSHDTNQFSRLTISASYAGEKFGTIFQNHRVQIFEYLLLPGERERSYTSNDLFFYFISGDRFLIVFDEKKNLGREARVEVQGVYWVEGGYRYIENIGNRPIRALKIELMDSLDSRVRSFKGTQRKTDEK